MQRISLVLNNINLFEDVLLKMCEKFYLLRNNYHSRINIMVFHLQICEPKNTISSLGGLNLDTNRWMTFLLFIKDSNPLSSPSLKSNPRPTGSHDI